MKKLSKVLVLSLLALLFLCTSLIPAFAAVNGKDAQVGSTVEYTISIADSVQAISGIHLEIFFDQTALELKEVNVDNLGESTVVNENQNEDGTIKVVNGLINGTKGLVCADKTDLVKVTFEVIGEIDTEIKYYIPYLYDYDMVNLYEYTLSQTIAIDGEVAVENIPPVLADDSDFAKIENFDKGDFANYEQGTGSGVKVEPTTAKKSADDSSGNQEDGAKNNSTIIIACVCVVVVAAAVVVLVMAKSKANKQTADTEE